jgi:hypothetical protein
MQCLRCGGLRGVRDAAREPATWLGQADCTCLAQAEDVAELLRLLTLLSNFGLSAAAPPVLQSSGAGRR